MSYFVRFGATLLFLAVIASSYATVGWYADFSGASKNRDDISALLADQESVTAPSGDASSQANDVTHRLLHELMHHPLALLNDACLASPTAQACSHAVRASQDVRSVAIEPPLRPPRHLFL